MNVLVLDGNINTWKISYNESGNRIRMSPVSILNNQLSFAFRISAYKSRDDIPWFHNFY